MKLLLHEIRANPLLPWFGGMLVLMVYLIFAKMLYLLPPGAR